MKKLTTLSLIALIIMGMLPSCGTKKEETPEPPKAMNVIYMIGDGMALPQVYAAMLASHEKMTFSQFNVPPAAAERRGFGWHALCFIYGRMNETTKGVQK